MSEYQTANSGEGESKGDPSGGSVRLYLLRHGEVRSHRGDVPITSAAQIHAADVGAGLAGAIPGTVTLLCGETRRAVETAEHLGAGIERTGCTVEGPTVAFALRNPDLYLAGVRVNMVSSHETLAAQVPGLGVDDVADLEFFPEFIAESDRIGWWLRHPNPPGEGALAVTSRIRAFARSLADRHRPTGGVVVAVTHSPLIRAVGLSELGHDIGEPDWVAGLTVDIDPSGALTTARFPATAG